MMEMENTSMKMEVEQQWRTLTKRKTIRCPHCQKKFQYPKKQKTPFSDESKNIAESMTNLLYYWATGKGREHK